MASALSVQKNHFQVQSLLSLSMTLIFSYPVKESTPILWCFSPLLPYRILHFCPLESSTRITGQLTIHSILQGTFHFFSYEFKEFSGEGGNLLLFTIRMALFELKIPPREISLLRGNE